MDANDREHFAPSGATVFECFKAINISLLRSKDSCVKYIDTVETVSRIHPASPTGLSPV